MLLLVPVVPGPGREWNAGRCLDSIRERSPALKSLHRLPVLERERRFNENKLASRRLSHAKVCLRYPWISSPSCTKRRFMITLCLNCILILKHGCRLRDSLKRSSPKTLGSGNCEPVLASPSFTRSSEPEQSVLFTISDTFCWKLSCQV